MENFYTFERPRRTALYARVSTGHQSTGLEAQVRALKLYCDQNNIESFELFTDENQSGAKASRPALDRMMKTVESGEVETVIAFAFSRFARSVSHMLKGLEVMKKQKTNFVSLTEKIDLNTSLGNVVFILISAIAQLERDLIAERVRNGMANAKAKGIKIGRERKRNSALIESLLEAGLSFREVARIARCSHGSVSAQKKEWLAKKAANEKKNLVELTKNITSSSFSSTVEQMKAMNLSEDMVEKVQAKLENDARDSVRGIQGDVVYATVD